jgi:glycosyl transferase family 87
VERLVPSAVAWRRLWRDAAIAVAVAICLARFAGLVWPFAVDFHAYYTADLDQPYVGSVPGGAGAFLYSPLFAQVTEPLRWLPFNIALSLWTALELGSLIYLAGPWSLLLFLPLAPEWMDGNVHLVMAAAVYAGIRGQSSWTWTVPAFTKLAPVIGLAWFAFRRDWSILGRAVAVLGGLLAISLVASPEAWVAWLQMLLANLGSQGPLAGRIGVPLLLRMPVALALLAWGARSNRPWTVPLACGLTMPSLWISAVIAFGIAALRLAELPDWRSIQAIRRSSVREPDPAPTLVAASAVATSKP